MSGRAEELALEASWVSSEEAYASYKITSQHGYDKHSCDVLRERILKALQQAQTEAFNDGVEAAAIAVQESADDTFAGFGMVMKLEVDKEEVMRTFHKSQLQAVEAIQKLKKEVK